MPSTEKIVRKVKKERRVTSTRLIILYMRQRQVLWRRVYTPEYREQVGKLPRTDRAEIIRNWEEVCRRPDPRRPESIEEYEPTIFAGRVPFVARFPCLDYEFECEIRTDDNDDRVLRIMSYRHLGNLEHGQTE